MNNKNFIIKNIDKIHTTDMGLNRIKKNLDIDANVIAYIKNKILENNAVFISKGKNIYCEVDDIIITINRYSFTIITAHKK